jgi:histidyl-tRNA synthetase
VAIVGDSEIEVGKVMLKNMVSGEQQLLTVEEVIALILG